MKFTSPLSRLFRKIKNNPIFQYAGLLSPSFHCSLQCFYTLHACKEHVIAADNLTALAMRATCKLAESISERSENEFFEKYESIVE